MSIMDEVEAKAVSASVVEKLGLTARVSDASEMATQAFVVDVLLSRIEALEEWRDGLVTYWGQKMLDEANAKIIRGETDS